MQTHRQWVNAYRVAELSGQRQGFTFLRATIFAGSKGSESPADVHLVPLPYLLLKQQRKIVKTTTRYCETTTKYC